MRPWFVRIVGVLLLCGVTPIYGHQGVEHGSEDESESASAYDEAAPAQIVKTKIPLQSKSGRTRWGADFFPNVELVTHQGKKVRFFDDLLRDRVVMINFMYASCTESCSLATAQLKRVQQILGDRVGKDVFMYSITIDPKNDTPEVLNKHVEKFNIGPGWLFLTGDAKDIMNLRYRLGFHFQGIRDDLKDHNGAVLMGNQPTGQWLKRSPMDNPYFLAEQFGTWLTNWKTPSKFSNNDYSEAPQLQVSSMGENLFRSRCTACHTIGGNTRTIGREKNTESSIAELGPDLLDVTRKRDRAWLARWLSNPARMLAEKDPVAIELYTRYRKILMPNFHLNKTEVNALIDYMEAESSRVGKAADPMALGATL